MPQQTALVVNDSVPASRTFQLGGVANGIATWYEKTSAYVQGWLKQTFQLRMPTKAGVPIRHTFRIVMPTAGVSAIDGVSIVELRRSTANIEVVIAPGATALEKADMCAYIANTFSLATYGMKQQIINTEPTT